MNVYTADFAKEGTYDLRIVVKYSNYPAVFNTKDFTVVVQATCTPSSVSITTWAHGDQSYTIALPQLDTAPFTLMTPTPFWCVLTHETTISPIPTDSTLIVYNGDMSLSWSIYGTDISLAGIYTLGY